MVSILPGSLSAPDAAIVRKLFKVLRATKYEDPVDQDTFLSESARTILPFRLQIASFALDSGLAECVFMLRSMMHANGTRLGAPPSSLFTAIQAFAGEIISKRHILQERKRANAERSRVADSIAARISRNAALEFATKETTKPPGSPNDETVSIPSGSDESGPPGLQSCAPSLPTSPIQVEPTSAHPSSQGNLSFLRFVFTFLIAYTDFTCQVPIRILSVVLSSFSVLVSTLSQPSSPLSSGRSLPDLVPDFVLGPHRLPVKDDDWKRGRTPVRNLNPRRAPRTHGPVVQCNMLRMPFGPPPLSPKNNFVGAWLRSKPKSAGFQQPKRNFSGNSKPSVNPSRPLHRQPHKSNLLLFFFRSQINSIELKIFAFVWLRIIFQLIQGFCRDIQEFFNVWTKDCTVKLAHNRSRFLPLKDPSSTVFLTSTTSPGPNS
ncbi:hypothetical protein DFH09DRAFT_1312772 [Mycena vulgaris]|nr:hypothetical protein DFH09DRAFT_1312772 [Mycena vulgaris]